MLTSFNLHETPKKAFYSLINIICLNTHLNLRENVVSKKHTPTFNIIPSVLLYFLQLKKTAIFRNTCTAIDFVHSVKHRINFGQSYMFIEKQKKN